MDLILEPSIEGDIKIAMDKIYKQLRIVLPPAIKKVWYLLKTLGRINCMSLVLFGFGVKFFAYSMLMNPWWILPIGILNGITFSTFYATMASHAATVAAPGTEATILAIVSVSYEGIGTSLGSVLAGVLLFYFDGFVVFQFYGIIAMCVSILHIFVQKFVIYNKIQGVNSH